eukprot:919482-Prymnesium_polylepis.1
MPTHIRVTELCNIHRKPVRTCANPSQICRKPFANAWIWNGGLPPDRLPMRNRRYSYPLGFIETGWWESFSQFSISASTYC